MSVFVHKTISVDGGERYLSFAMGRIRALEKLPGPLSQSYAVDAVIIRVKVNCPAGHHYVHIVGGDEIAFDFFTPTSWTDDFDPTTVIAYGGVEGVFTSVIFYASGAYKCVPLASREIGGGKYRTVKVADAAGGAPFDVHEVPLREIYNLQKNPQYVWWQGEEKDGQLRYTKNFCVSAYGAANFYGATPLDLWSYTVNPVCGKDLAWYLNPLGQAGDAYVTLHNSPQSAAMETDIGQDVGFTYFSSDRADASTLNPTTEMPRFLRRACVRKVSHPTYGTREFVVYTDSFSNFEVFPLGAPAAENQPARTRGYPKAEYRRRFDFADIAPNGVVVPTTATMSRGWRYDGFLSDPAYQTMANGQQAFSAQAWGAFRPSVPTEVAFIGGVLDYVECPQPALDLIDDDALVDSSWDQELYYQKHQYLWRFNSTGTRAVARVNANERSILSTLKDMDGAHTLQPGDSDTLGFGPDLFAHTWLPFTPLKKPKGIFNAPFLTKHFEANHASFFDPYGGVEEAKVYDHYHLELDIQIELTGFGDNDYTAAVAVHRMLTDKMAISADYAYGHPDIAARGFAHDDLVVMEVSCFWGVHTAKDMYMFPPAWREDLDTSYGEGRLLVRNYAKGGATPISTYLDIVCYRHHWIYLKYAQHVGTAFNRNDGASYNPNPHELGPNIAPKIGRYRWNGYQMFVRGVPYVTTGLDGWVDNNGHLYAPPVVSDRAGGLESTGSQAEFSLSVTGFDLRALAVEMSGIFYDLSVSSYAQGSRRFDVTLGFGAERSFVGDRGLYDEARAPLAGMTPVAYDYGQLPLRSTDPSIVNGFDMRDSENDLMRWTLGRFQGSGPNAPVYLPMLETHMLYSWCHRVMRTPEGQQQSILTHPSGGFVNSRAPTLPADVGFNAYTGKYVTANFPATLPQPAISYVSATGKETKLPVAEALFSAWGLTLNPDTQLDNHGAYYQVARMQEHMCRFGIWRQLTRREAVPEEFVLEVY